MPGRSDIERLIDEGLSRYGAGDLDGALLSWEEALTLDPGNEQATSYVDYLRQNYDLLTRGGDTASGGTFEDGVPFGIPDEPDYTIEVKPGELEADPGSFTGADDLDTGWFLDAAADDGDDDDDDDHDPGTATRKVSPEALAAVLAEPPPVNDDPAPLELELEADEPPEPAELELGDPLEPFASVPQPAPTSGSGASRRYAHLTPRRSSLTTPPVMTSPAAAAPAMAPADAAGFGDLDLELGPPRGQAEAAQPLAVDDLPDIGGPDDGSDSFGTTGVRRRELGFVQPVAEPAAGGTGAPELDDMLELGAAGRGDADRPPPRAAPPGAPSPGELPRATTLHIPLPPRLPATAETAAVGDDDETVARLHAPTQELGIRVRGGALDEATGAALTQAPTRELGLRDGLAGLAPIDDEDLPTGQSDARAIRRDAEAHEGTTSDLLLPFDPIAARSAPILEEMDAGAPAGEAPDERTRRRITWLFDQARAWSAAGEADRAVAAIDLALAEDPNAALAQKLIHRNRETMTTVFQAYLGDLDRQPRLARPLHELANAPISPRAAFLLSRVDGVLSLDEILDISGMPRLEAMRHLCLLYLRNILA